MEEKDEVFTPPNKRPLSSHNRQSGTNTRCWEIAQQRCIVLYISGPCGIAGHKALSQQGHLVAAQVLAGRKQVVIPREESKQSLIVSL